MRDEADEFPWNHQGGDVAPIGPPDSSLFDIAPEDGTCLNQVLDSLVVMNDMELEGDGSAGPVDATLTPLQQAQVDKSRSEDLLSWSFQQLQIDGAPHGELLKSEILRRVTKSDVMQPGTEWQSTGDPHAAIAALLSGEKVDVAAMMSRSPVYAKWHETSLNSRMQSFVKRFFDMPVVERQREWEALRVQAHDRPPILEWLGQIRPALTTVTTRVTDPAILLANLTDIYEFYRKLPLAYGIEKSQMRRALQQQVRDAPETNARVALALQEACPELVQLNHAIHLAIIHQKWSKVPKPLNSYVVKRRRNKASGDDSDAWVVLLIIVGGAVGLLLGLMRGTKSPPRYQPAPFQVSPENLPYSLRYPYPTETPEEKHRWRRVEESRRAMIDELTAEAGTKALDDDQLIVDEEVLKKRQEDREYLIAMLLDESVVGSVNRQLWNWVTETLRTRIPAGGTSAGSAGAESLWQVDAEFVYGGGRNSDRFLSVHELPTITEQTRWHGGAPVRHYRFRVTLPWTREDDRSKIVRIMLRQMSLPQSPPERESPAVEDASGATDVEATDSQDGVNSTMQEQQAED
ncbi:MAG: hypothetical protein R3C01_16560 [Planctomycetaceae bacterium]